MNERVVRRDQAKRDLVKHFVYLTERVNADSARRFLAATNAACDLLVEMPELGPRRSFKNPKLTEVRMWPVKGGREFLIFYEPMSNGIRLLRVIHAKEDYWRVLGQ